MSPLPSTKPFASNMVKWDLYGVCTLLSFIPINATPGGPFGPRLWIQIKKKNNHPLRKGYKYDCFSYIFRKGSKE